MSLPTNRMPGDLIQAVDINQIAEAVNALSEGSATVTATDYGDGTVGIEVGGDRIIVNGAIDNRTIVNGNFKEYFKGGTTGAFTSMWGWYNDNDLVSDSSMWIDSATFPNNTTFRWTVDRSTTSWQGVQGYLHIYYGNLNGSPGVVTPRQVKDIGTLTVDAAWTLAGDQSSGLLAEFWLTGSPHPPGEGVQGDMLFEVAYFPKNSPESRVWLDTLPIIATYTDLANVQWEVREGVSGSAPIPYLIADRVDRQAHQGRFYYVDYLNALYGSGKITGNEWFNGLGFGVEPWDGASSLTVDTFSVDYKGGAAMWLPQNRLVNSDFSDASGAPWDGFGWGGKSIVGGVAKFNEVAAWSGISQSNVPIVGGKYYELEFTISNYVKGGVGAVMRKKGSSTPPAVGFGPNKTGNGTHRARALAGDGFNEVRLDTPEVSTYDLDNVKLTGPFNTSTVGGA